MKVEILRRDCPSRSPHFNPLRPCGRRLNGYFYFNTDDLFQSTPPVWAETRLLFGSLIQAMKFQSTPPVWAETTQVDHIIPHKGFQSTPPVWAET